MALINLINCVEKKGPPRVVDLGERKPDKVLWMTMGEYFNWLFRGTTSQYILLKSFNSVIKIMSESAFLLYKET